MSFSQTIQNIELIIISRTHSGHEKLAFLEFEYYLTIDSANTKEGDSIVIPLKVTHPNVNVSMYRQSENGGVDYHKVIYTQLFGTSF